MYCSPSCGRINAFCRRYVCLFFSMLASSHRLRKANRRMDKGARGREMNSICISEEYSSKCLHTVLKNIATDISSQRTNVVFFPPHFAFQKRCSEIDTSQYITQIFVMYTQISPEFFKFFFHLFCPSSHSTKIRLNV